MKLFSRRRLDAALIAKLTAELTSQRAIIADLGRQLDAAADPRPTVPMPRVRSQAPLTTRPVRWESGQPTNAIDVTSPGEPAGLLMVPGAAWEQQPTEWWRET